MGLEMQQIAEAFCSHRFAETYATMAPEIKWNIIGREVLVGRAAVINQCDLSAKYLATVTTTITKLETIRAEPIVVVEGAAHFVDQAGQTSGVASCDVFRFADGLLVEINSYNVDVTYA